VAARRHGFTLLEMAVVLAIAVILGAIAAPSFSGLVERQQLHAAAHHLQADISLARQEAGRLGAPVLLSFQPGPQWCYAISSGSAADCRTGARSADSGIIKVVRAADHPGIVLVDANPMVIDPRTGSRPTAEARARFATLAGLQLQLRLGPMGRASVCAPAAPMAGVPACAGAPAS
jgi:type IV fimbrial biogenesis protein FimT